MTKVVCTIPGTRFKKFGVNFPAGWEVEYLNDATAEEELVSACKGADFLFVQSIDTVSRSVILNSPSLRLIHVEGVAFDKVDTEAAKGVGLAVCNNRAVNSIAAAEHTIGLMISGLRRIPLADKQLKHRSYADVQTEFWSLGVHEIYSRHIGLVGMGAISLELVRRLAPFGCRISYFDVYRQTPERENELNLGYLPFEDLIKECDIISVHVPVLPNTVNMIGAKQFDQMKRTAFLVNTSRGEIIDQTALAEALENEKIYGAAVDTIAPEPPQKDHPLLTLSEEAASRLIITPHIAGTTNEAFTRMLKWAITNMQLVMEGKPPNNVVNGVEITREPSLKLLWQISHSQ